MLLRSRRLRFRLDPTSVPGLVYALGALMCWPVPLLQIVHVESAALWAGVSFFAAGSAAVFAFRRRQEPFGAVLGRQLAWLLVPLYLLTVTAFWAPNHGYLQGLMFFGLFPAVSVTFAVGLAYALTGRQADRALRRFWAVGLALVVVTPLYDLWLHPQFYTYNHVFGGILGPVYDEELAVRYGLFVFRGMTLLWALVCWTWGVRQRGADVSLHTGVRLAALAVLAVAYVFPGRAGINTTRSALVRGLPGLEETPHFRIAYDPQAATPAWIAWVRLEHEYRRARLVEATGVDPEEQILSYVYPTEDVKAALNGARRTNVAPIWLPDPQMHMLQEAFPDVFPHELAHVFSRPFGIPFVNASLSVGLIEGWAVALEPPDGRPGPADQVAAAVNWADTLGYATPETLARQIAARLSPFGFWTSRGAVSYTTMGSFVRFLLERYGPESFMTAYPWVDFESAYGKPVDALAEEWAAHIRGLNVRQPARSLSRDRFSRPSLLERPSPHYVPRALRAVRRAEEALTEGDTTQALAHLEQSLSLEPMNLPATELWANTLLALGEASAVRSRLEAPGAPFSPGLAVRLADARALTGDPAGADSLYIHVLEALPVYERTSRALIQVRRRLIEAPRQLAERVRGRPSRPDTSTVPEARLWTALQFAAADSFAVAADLLEFASPPDADELERIRLVWLGAMQSRLGRYSDAAETLAAARQSYAEAGDVDEVQRLRDQEHKVAWLREHAGMQ